MLIWWVLVSVVETVASESDETRKLSNEKGNKENRTVISAVYILYITKKNSSSEKISQFSLHIGFFSFSL